MAFLPDCPHPSSMYDRRDGTLTGSLTFAFSTQFCILAWEQKVEMKIMENLPPIASGHLGYADVPLSYQKFYNIMHVAARRISKFSDYELKGKLRVCSNMDCTLFDLSTSQNDYVSQSIT